MTSSPPDHRASARPEAVETAVLPAGQALELAAGFILAGRPVAIPTETVYGLAADAGSGEALAEIFAAKARPRFNPLIVHVADLAMGERIGRFDDLSLRLARHFWPGPLTLVVPLRGDAGIHPLALAGLPTVALRSPRGFGASLIARTGRPLAAPSANRSGRVSPTTAAAAWAELAGRIPLVVDGGPAAIGLESTIVKAEEAGLRLLRPGGVPAADIEAVAGMRLRRDAGAGVEAPGMLASHYAPDAGLRLRAADVRPGEALLAFGPGRIAGAAQAREIRNLSASGDLAEAARNLFGYLQALDASGAPVIAVEPVPDHGLGEAINDRLRRAAAPRPGQA